MLQCVWGSIPRSAGSADSPTLARWVICCQQRHGYPDAVFACAEK